MATHVFNAGAGIGAQVGATGGVTGNGGVAGTTTIDEIIELDDGGSNVLGISYEQIGFANAPSSASASSRASLIWKLVGTTQCQLRVQDDSSASGEIGTSDFAATYRPIADRPPTLNSFEGATGDYSAYQYNSSTYYYRAQNYTDGEGFVDTYYVAEWNNVGLGNGNAFVSGPLTTGNTFVGGDGNTYKLGPSQGTTGTFPNTAEDWSIAQLDPDEEHYRYTTSNNVTALKMDFNVTSIVTNSSSTAPLRTLNGSGIGLGVNSTGWVTSNLATGISLDITQLTGNVSDELRTHTIDGIVKLYAKTASEEGLLKEFRLRVHTTANSTY